MKIRIVLQDGDGVAFCVDEWLRDHVPGLPADCRQHSLHLKYIQSVTRRWIRDDRSVVLEIDLQTGSCEVVPVDGDSTIHQGRSSSEQLRRMGLEVEVTKAKRKKTPAANTPEAESR